MKRATIIIASILVILGAGGLFYTKQFSQNSESTPQKATYNSKNKKKTAQSTSSSQSSESSSSKSLHSSSAESGSTSSEEHSSASQSSSKTPSSTSSSSSSEEKTPSSKQSTGNAGKVKNGAGAMGDHKIKGEEVTKPTIDAIKKRMDSLGYNSSAWSPQDVINMYRKAADNGHDSVDSITKEDIESYLKK